MADVNAENVPHSSNKDTVPLQRKRYKSCFFAYITLLSRLWGIVLLAGLWTLTVVSFKYYKSEHGRYYILTVAILVSFIELIWFYNKLACCSVDDSCCCKIWKVFLWIDDWRKTIIYVLLSVPFFTEPLRDIFTLLAASLLIVCAFFYLMKSFQMSSCVLEPAEEECITKPGMKDEAVDATSRLVSAEPNNYGGASAANKNHPSDVVVVTTTHAPTLATVPVTSHPSPSTKKKHAPKTPSPQPPKKIASPKKEEEEEVPVGYKFDYGTPEVVNTDPIRLSVEKPQVSNPYDYENIVVEDKSDNEHKKGQAPPPPNPFEEDDESFEHKIESDVPAPKSTNPFE